MDNYGLRATSILEGSLSEDLFSKTLSKRGWSVIPADKEMQFNHIDFALEKDKVKFTVDVKSKKRISSQNENHNQEWLWVEFAGHSGKPGWLYGQASHIAFQLEDGFLLVSRKPLADFCESKINLNAPTWEWATDPQEAKYKLYRRWTAFMGKSEEKSALIKLEDLKSEIKTRLIPF